MAASSVNSRKPFQRIIRYPTESLAMLGRHVEQLEDNIAKKFRGVDEEVQTIGTTPTAEPDRTIKALDNAYRPVGNWSFDIAPGTTVADLSGYGCTLSIETGTMRTTNMHPTFGGVYFDGATNLRNVTPQPQLQIHSDLTIIIMGMWADLPGTVTTWLSYGTAGETSDTNVLYMAQFDSSSQFVYFSEHGAGVNDTANTLSTAGRYQPFLLCMTRTAGGELNHGLNGVFAGSSFGTVTLPTDGVNGIVRIGADNVGANFLKAILGQIVIYNTVLTGAQFLERYNSSLGGAFGFK